MIRLERLQFHYPASAFALDVPALRVRPGQRVALIGPSGCGKSTLLSLIAGILSPDAGRIVVDGTELASLGEAGRREFRLHRLGLVFQEFELLESLSVLDNVLLPYRLGSLALDGAVRERARQLLERVGLGEVRRSGPAQLSQGERQRVAVCRALVTRPALLLADEPTGNLDPARKTQVMALLFELCAAAGATLLATTHDHGLLADFDEVHEFASLTASSREVAP